MKTIGRHPCAGDPDHPAGMLDLLPVAVAELDTAGRVIRVNRALADLLDQPAETAAGHRLEDCGWEAVGAGARAALAELIAEPIGEVDQPDGRLLELRHRDGRRLIVRAQVRRVAPGDPEAGLVVVLSDVTAEQELRHELLTQQEQYRLLADHIGDVVIAYRGLSVVWASGSARRVLGLEAEELIGQELADCAHPDDIRPTPTLLSDRSPQQRRLRLRHGDGTYHWFAATFSGRWDDAGQLVETYASLRDIDEQVAAEDAAALNERRLRMVFDASPDGLTVYEAARDETGQITGLVLVSINPAALAGTARNPDEVVGLDVRQLVPGCAEGGFFAELVATMEGAGPMRGQRVLDLGAGERVYDALSAQLDQNLLLVAWRDVTDALEGERLLERAYEETAEMRVTLQTALDATSDAFAVYALEWDPDRVLQGLRVVHANASAGLSLGLDPDEMVGMEIRDFFPEVDSSGLWDRILDAAITKAPQHHRVHQFDGDGEWLSSWDNSVAPVGEERMTITWRDVSAEESALRQLARHRDEAMHSATHDALTGLPNRILLREHLQESLRTCPPDRRVGIVFVDLDHFKMINDTYGHSAGDSVLCATAERLNRLVRHGDLAARLAGDEFVLVLTQLAADWTPDQFFARATVVLSEPLRAEDVELHPSASLGVVLADPRSGPVDVDTLIKDADAEMYQAKAARRGRS